MRILAIVLLSAALSAKFEPVRSEEVNFGVGGHICATFTKLRAKSPDAEPLFFSWAEGFLTAWNMASEKQVLKVDTTVMTRNEQRKFLVDYCEIHPANMYLEGVTALLAKLRYVKAQKTGKDEE
jgi:hypothetical protein